MHARPPTAPFEPELEVACKFAVLRAAGYRRVEIGRMLAVIGAPLLHAEERVKQVAELLDRGDD